MYNGIFNMNSVSSKSLECLMGEIGKYLLRNQFEVKQVNRYKLECMGRGLRWQIEVMQLQQLKSIFYLDCQKREGEDTLYKQHVVQLLSII